MITRNEITHIGRFNKTHGIAGEISATLQVPVSVLQESKCIVCDVDGIYVPFFIGNTRDKTASTVLLTIDGVNNENDASILVNKDIFLLKNDVSQLMQDEETPVDFFMNFNIKINGKNGEIINIDDSTANVLCEVRLDDNSVKLLPVADEFIISLDVDERFVEMEVPPELLEL